MTKDELITQVLNTTNIDLYNFWAMKLLTEYPEYQIKVKNNYSVWDKTISQKLFINNFSKDILGTGTCKNSEFFHYTFSTDLEWEGSLNWTLRNEQKRNIQ